MTGEHEVTLEQHWDDAVGLSCSCGAIAWVFVGYAGGIPHDLTLAEANAWAADHSVRPAHVTSWRASADAEWQ